MPDGNYYKEHEENKRLKRELEEMKARDREKRLANDSTTANEQTQRLEQLIHGGVHPELTGISELTRQFIASQGDISKISALHREALVPPMEPTYEMRPHVFQDASGATMIESRKFLSHLTHETAQRVVDERGLNIQLPPKDKWDGADVVKRQNWLFDHDIYPATELGKPTSELVLPEVGGGDAEIYWEEALAEIAYKEVVDPETEEMKIVEVPGEVSLAEAIKRLVILHEKSELPFDLEPPKKSVAEQIEELTGFIKERYLDKVKAARDGKKDFPIVSELVSTIESLKRKYELGEKSKYFDKIFDEKNRKDIITAKLELDRYFQKKKDSDPVRYAELFKQINLSADQVNRMQDAGWYSQIPLLKNNFRTTVQQEIRKAVSDEEKEMLRWQAQRLEEGMELHFLETSVNQPPGDWRDSGQNLDKILRQLERTDFNEQQLQTSLNAAVRIVSLIPVSTLEGQEKKEAEELRKVLEERLNAILAVNSFYSVMEHASMDPEKVIGVFSSFKDHTFHQFFERFNHDSKGNAIKYKNEEGEEKKLNLLSAGMNVYMKRLNRERKVMNYVEKWTRNIDVRVGSAEKGLEAECEAAVEHVRASIRKATGRDSRDVGHIKDAVADWYRNNTLLGAHDEHKKDKRKEEMVGDLKLFEEKTDGEKAHADARLWKQGLIEELRDKYKIGDEQLKEMIDSGLVEQVMNNAYRLSWVMAWSDYDGIRIWDPKAENPAKPGTGRVSAFVYNGDTNLFYGRMTDHVWEFFVDENRGKVPKSNLIMQDGLLGDYGNLFPQNRTLVRFVGDALGDEAKAYLKDKRGGFKNIDRMDMDNHAEEGWAQSAVYAEGLDKGELSLENVDWLDFFRAESSWKYKWIDLYSDRKEMKDFVSPAKLQKYLQQPNSEAFLQLFSLDNFYSKREVRLQPAMKLAIPIHQQLGDFWKAWWGENDRMTHAEKEAIIEIALRTNRLDIKYKDWMKRNYLGWGGMPGVMPIRTARQWAEAGDVFGREFSTGVLWKDTINFLPGSLIPTSNQFFKYVTSGTLT